jgi:uncharacterized protein YgbK (DUF1537 family)
MELEWTERARQALAQGHTPVLYTSRGELRCRHAAERRALGLALAAAMARVTATLAPALGYVISKGGITTHTLLADGLGQGWVALRGQLLPGLSLVVVPDQATCADRPTARRTGLEGLPVLTVPGNLGRADTLDVAWRVMEDG